MPNYDSFLVQNTKNTLTREAQDISPVKKDFSSVCNMEDTVVDLDQSPGNEKVNRIECSRWYRLYHTMCASSKQADVYMRPLSLTLR